MKIFNYIFLLIPAITMWGNSFSQQVISSAGGSASGSGIELSWTIGEPITATAKGTDFFLTQGFHQSEILTKIYNHEISFDAGWNIFSTYVMPENPDMKAIFQSLIDDGSLVKIQDETGNSLEDWGIFGGWTNNIGALTSTEGYKVKVKQNCQITIAGNLATFPFKIPLEAGWNIIGYPRINEADAASVVQQLIDHGTLIKVQDEAGNSLEDWGIFGGWTNNIGDFIPGEGYKIKLNAKDTLWIYDSYSKKKTIMPEQLATMHFAPEFEGNGVDHMNFNLVGLPINILEEGDELAIFDGTTCVGAVTIMTSHLIGQTVSIALSASDYQGMKGFSEGNLITLKLWNSKQNQEFSLVPEIINGTSTFMKNETTVASLEKYATTGLDGLSGLDLPKIKVFPNPFSDVLNIAVYIPYEEFIELEIYDVLGRKVKELYSGNNPGKLTLLWNGENNNGNKVVAGIYLMRVNEFKVKIIRN